MKVHHAAILLVACSTAGIGCSESASNAPKSPSISVSSKVSAPVSTADLEEIQKLAKQSDEMGYPVSTWTDEQLASFETVLGQLDSKVTVAAQTHTHYSADGMHAIVQTRREWLSKARETKVEIARINAQIDELKRDREVIERGDEAFLAILKSPAPNVTWPEEKLVAFEANLDLLQAGAVKTAQVTKDRDASEIIKLIDQIRGGLVVIRAEQAQLIQNERDIAVGAALEVAVNQMSMATPKKSWTLGDLDAYEAKLNEAEAKAKVAQNIPEFRGRANTVLEVVEGLRTKLKAARTN